MQKCAKGKRNLRIKFIFLCQTCWVEQHYCILKFINLLIFAANSLDKIANDRDTDYKIFSIAVTVNPSFCTAKFICIILIMKRVLSVLLSISHPCQSPKMNLMTFVEQIEIVINIF